MNEEQTPSLVERYYTAEKSVWFLFGLIFLFQFADLNVPTSVPWLSVVLKDGSKLPHVLGALLVGAVLWISLEWKESSDSARNRWQSKVRCFSALIGTVIGFWELFPFVTQGTDWQSVSRIWFFGFGALGIAFGFIASELAFASLLIRPKKEAEALRLPRIPIATQSMHMGCGIIFVVLVITFGIFVRVVSVDVLKAVFWIVPISIIATFALIRVPVSKALRNAVATHDYHYLLSGDNISKRGNEIIANAATPPQQQKAISKSFAQKGADTRFRTEVIDEISFQFYAADGDPKNELPSNRAVKVLLKDTKAKGARVKILTEDGSKELLLSIGALEMNATDLIRKQAKPLTRTKEYFSAVINQTVKDEIKNIPGVLHAAVEAGDQGLVEELLTKGHDLNQKGAYGWTPLLAAVAQGYVEIVKLLLKKGANPDLANLNGITPLMYAARYDNAEIAKQLLKYSPALDAQDVYGNTALAVAAKNGFRSVAELLVAAGARVDIQNREQLNAIDLAHRSKNGDLARILRNSIAKK